MRKCSICNINDAIAVNFVNPTESICDDCMQKRFVYECNKCRVTFTSMINIKETSVECPHCRTHLQNFVNKQVLPNKIDEKETTSIITPDYIATILKLDNEPDIVLKLNN